MAHTQTYLFLSSRSESRVASNGTLQITLSFYFNFPLLQFCSVFIFSLFMVNKWFPINDNNDWEFDFIDCYLVISVNKLMVYTDLFCVGWEKKETDSLVTYLFIYLFCLPILSSNQFRMSCQQEGELLLGIWTGQVLCFCVLTVAMAKIIELETINSLSVCRTMCL